MPALAAAEKPDGLSVRIDNPGGSDPPTTLQAYVPFSLFQLPLNTTDGSVSSKRACTSNASTAMTDPEAAAFRAPVTSTASV